MVRKHHDSWVVDVQCGTVAGASSLDILAIRSTYADVKDANQHTVKQNAKCWPTSNNTKLTLGPTIIKQGKNSFYMSYEHISN